MRKTNRMVWVGDRRSSSERTVDSLVDDAWERMERDLKSEEAEKASARLLVGALVRAAEEPQPTPMERYLALTSEAVKARLFPDSYESTREER